MDDVKKILFIGYWVAIAFCILVVPWQIPQEYGKTSSDGSLIRNPDGSYVTYIGDKSVGYSFVLQPPQKNASVNIGQIVINAVIVTVVAGLAYKIAKKLND